MPHTKTLLDDDIFYTLPYGDTWKIGAGIQIPNVASFKKNKIIASGFLIRIVPNLLYIPARIYDYKNITRIIIVNHV